MNSEEHFSAMKTVSNQRILQQYVINTLLRTELQMACRIFPLFVINEN